MACDGLSVQIGNKTNIANLTRLRPPKYLSADRQIWSLLPRQQILVPSYLASAERGPGFATRVMVVRMWLACLDSGTKWAQEETLYADNKGAVDLTETTAYNKRLKYITVRYHWTREMPKKGGLKYQYLPNTDILTYFIDGFGLHRNRERSLTGTSSYFHYPCFKRTDETTLLSYAQWTTQRTVSVTEIVLPFGSEDDSTRKMAAFKLQNNIR